MAVCCSRDSLISRFRASSSLNRRTFSIAITAWSEKVFPAYALIPDLGWAVLVERPASEAYELLYASVLRTSILLLFGLGLAVAASLIIGRRVVRPIAVLREGAARIGAGALEHRINVQTGDELEALAGEFNSMAGRVQESYANPAGHAVKFSFCLVSAWPSWRA